MVLDIALYLCRFVWKLAHPLSLVAYFNWIGKHFPQGAFGDIASTTPDHIVQFKHVTDKLRCNIILKYLTDGLTRRLYKQKRF